VLELASIHSTRGVRDNSARQTLQALWSRLFAEIPPLFLQDAGLRHASVHIKPVPELIRLPWLDGEGAAERERRAHPPVVAHVEMRGMPEIRGMIEKG
jgi:hypothetical protein